jgi:hypothetical protein
MSEKFSLISYFLPGLNLTRLHLLHYERDLGPRIQAQHLLSLQARVVQLLLLHGKISFFLRQSLDLKILKNLLT